MALTEKELLLLDCFMYSDIAPKCEDMSVEAILKQYTNDNGKVTPEALKKANVKLSGSITKEEMADVMNQMLNNDSIKTLRLTHVTDEYEGSIRAGCFVDESGKATAAFRGTGGSYQQWMNNFEGYGELAQQSQLDAAAFINSLPYKDIDVTGHSNGGDQAMYVSIICADKVSRCVSYEGQGLSKEFVSEYADEIAENKHKIKNICGSKDFVSPLLVDISSETHYVNSDSELAGGYLNHGAYGILTANQQSLDDNGGNFPEESFVDQAWYCTAIHWITVGLSGLSDVPGVGPTLELVADVVGVIVAMSISGSWSDPEYLLIACNDLITSLSQFVFHNVDMCIAAIRDTCNNFSTWVANFFYNGKGYAQANPLIKVNTVLLDNYAQRLHAVNSRIAKIDERIDSLYWRVGLLDLWNLMCADIFTGYSGHLTRCASYLSEISADLVNIENELTSAFNN